MTYSEVATLFSETGVGSQVRQVMYDVRLPANRKIRGPTKVACTCSGRMVNVVEEFEW